MIRSLRTASEAIRNGEVVCIFAEGQITRIGQLLPFRRGFERIMKNVDAPIIPVHLDGVWGSIFSFERGTFPMEVAPTRAASHHRELWRADAARPRLQSKSARPCRNCRPRRQGTRQAAEAAALRVHQDCAAASLSCGHGRREQALRFGAALMRAIFLARRLEPEWAGQDMVGILLPPSLAGALVNFAALLCGKIPVNLNYTLSSEGIASCARQCSHPDRHHLESVSRKV